MSLGAWEVAGNFFLCNPTRSIPEEIGNSRNPLFQSLSLRKNCPQEYRTISYCPPRSLRLRTQKTNKYIIIYCSRCCRRVDPPKSHASQRLSKAVQPNANWHMGIAPSSLDPIFTICHTSPSSRGIDSVHHQRFDMRGFHGLLYFLVL